MKYSYCSEKASLAISQISLVPAAVFVQYHHSAPHRYAVSKPVWRTYSIFARKSSGLKVSYCNSRELLEIGGCATQGSACTSVNIARTCGKSQESQRALR